MRAPSLTKKTPNDRAGYQKKTLNLHLNGNFQRKKLGAPPKELHNRNAIPVFVVQQTREDTKAVFQSKTMHTWASVDRKSVV